MNRHLLDTNILSDFVDHPEGRAAIAMRRVPDAAIMTSIVVAAELRFGAVKRGSARLARRVEAALALMPVLPLAPPADAVYARIRTALERRGTPIGSNDLFIAATALAAGAVLVTHNTREFRRVDGLEVEDWLA